MDVKQLQQMKREGRKIVGVVAWDFQIARIADRAGVDLVSVGDSVGINLWGRADPEDMTLDESEKWTDLFESTVIRRTRR